MNPLSTQNSALSTISDANGQSLFYLKDGLGSVVAVVDGRGDVVQSYEYSAYGECLSGKDSVNQFRFVGGAGGRADDDTGLVYFWNRWYDAGAGRWVSEDPIRWQSRDADFYRYAAGNPVFYFDFEGTDLSNIDVRNIVFREVQNLRGSDISSAYYHIASAVWNGDERADGGGRGRPGSAPTTIGHALSDYDSVILGNILQQVDAAKTNRFGNSSCGPFRWRIGAQNELNTIGPEGNPKNPRVPWQSEDGPFRQKSITGDVNMTSGIYVFTY